MDKVFWQEDKNRVQPPNPPQLGALDSHAVKSQLSALDRVGNKIVSFMVEPHEWMIMFSIQYQSNHPRADALDR